MEQPQRAMPGAGAGTGADTEISVVRGQAPLAPNRPQQVPPPTEVVVDSPEQQPSPNEALMDSTVRQPPPSQTAGEVLGNPDNSGDTRGPVSPGGASGPGIIPPLPATPSPSAEFRPPQVPLQPNVPSRVVTWGQPGALPGVTVDPNTFVVLSSRLGRKMVALPKINPDDPTETVKYHVPEAYERGEVITIDDIDVTGAAPGYENNLDRLLRLGAIARMDHPDAAEVIQALQVRRTQERLAERDRGVR